MKSNIRINFLGIKGFFLKRKIAKVYDTIAKYLGIDKPLLVNVGFVSGDAIQKLNKEHRQIDKPTDVLSFPFFDLKNGTGLEKATKDDMFDIDGTFKLGDILICEEIATLQAKNLGHSKKREICFLATHGFLHLLGFDHIDPDDEKLMNSIAQKALDTCGIKRK